MIYAETQTPNMTSLIVINTTTTLLVYAMPRVINQLSAIFDIEKVQNAECTETCQPVG
jgi:hypothetical protein